MTGAELKAIRERFNISQTDFAWLIGTIQVTISRWENQEKVPPMPAAFARVLDIADRMGLSPKVIMSALGKNPRERYSRR